MTFHEQFDAVVVGSGFGGSVMTYRLAEAGLRVCLLERGKSYPPGSFPRHPNELRMNFWDPSKGLYGMFNIWSFDHLEALTTSGLGGGSLTYANVLLRKPPEWFGEDRWPVKYGDLAQHYDAVEKMLDAQHYPFGFPPFSHTKKAGEFHRAARAIGLDPSLPQLAVSFRPAQGAIPVVGAPLIDQPLPDFHRRDGYANLRYTCRLCGECNFGCNYGSKNTLDLTYLRHAEALGADIRTLCDVLTFKPAPDGTGYLVTYRALNPKQPARPDAGLRTIHARQLILSAGSLGTTYLLLKNRAALPLLSRRLGHSFSGNGDYLAFVRQQRDAIENGQANYLNAGFGSVITSSLRAERRSNDGAIHHFFIQDGGLPAFVNWLSEREVAGLCERVKRIGNALTLIIKRMLGDSNVSAELSKLMSDRTGRTMPLLGMGLDAPGGKMTINEDTGLLEVDWSPKKSKAYFDAIDAEMERLATAMGGRLIRNWFTDYLGRLITAHPVGGCPMGRTRDEGVVSSYGEVFGYNGLFVADGSVAPGPIGPNPSLTIAALANRFAEKVIDNHQKRCGGVEAQHRRVVQAGAEAVV